jgi:hypothetical protein
MIITIYFWLFVVILLVAIGYSIGGYFIGSYWLFFY